MRRNIEEIYSSRKLINLNVRAWEKSLFQCLSHSEIMSASPQLKVKTNTKLEFVISWAMKKYTLPDPLWCDGVSIYDLQQPTKGFFKIKAKVFLGKEKGEYKMDKYQLVGTIQLAKNTNKIRSYKLEILSSENCFSVRKRA